MGWNSANEIFDPICEEIIRQVEKADGIYPSDATTLLSVIIHEFQQGDWDTEDESLHMFQDYDYVVAAFRQNGILIEEDEEQS